MARRKNKGGEGHENAERWLLTYADMITLLMAFFIMMYSMSVLNLAKFNEVAFSIRSGFGGVLTGRGPHLLDHQKPGSNETPATKMLMGKKASEMAEQRLKAYISENNLPGLVEVILEERGVVISVSTDDLLFSRGSAVLSPGAGELLKRIVALIATVKNDVLVEGHTCSLAINTAQFPSNWELSSARACSVLRHLNTHGIGKQRLSAAGYADTHPRRLNDTEAHRARNRRVDIVLLTQPRWSSGGHSPLPPMKPVAAQRDEVPRVMVNVRPTLTKVSTPEDAPASGSTKNEPSRSSH